ncbi:processive 1,2-diacylglycerol beta-glucosyltransferase [Clostridium algifaecis]|uniref:Processive 1,2-diacylglycerol beta-glucosyltransferase n=1 Tax=Clostridium algifaecis TaxID=1472040 RepID=A0ABS4KS29_9CLOT|nr:glycosyltransferase [Clostridium algifaecis]MBP2032837.1 processive 1,2-diacylglycerol beta-glucosyltransferase [Clostridium algifaecis]
MINNILIISSDFTGHGHKSIAEALCEKFKKHDNIRIHVVDGFSLGGTTLLNIGKAYGPITRKSESLWELIWDISSNNPSFINEIVEFKIKDRFLKLLKEVHPDLILTIHPNFNGSVINILEKYDIKIPVVTLIADLISISPLWADPRANYIISPTQEAKNKCIEFGVIENKIKVLGFPVRSRFYNYLNSYMKHNNYNANRPLKCLIMSGGEGVGNMEKIAEILLLNFNCTIKIVTGRNTALKNKLQQSLVEKYGSKVEIYGFLENIQDLMLSSDIAFTRGSPNVMLEAIACNIPLIITGALPGQEEENPKFIEKHNLGVVCSDINNIQIIINNLIANNGVKLNKIKHAQKVFSNPYTAENIVNFILNIGNDSNKVTIQKNEVPFVTKNLDNPIVYK